MNLYLTESSKSLQVHVLLGLFAGLVSRRIPKPAPLDTLLHNLLEVLGENR